MRGNYKKLVTEDKFARKYYCNAHRFKPKMKKENSKKLRRILKRDVQIKKGEIDWA